MVIAPSEWQSVTTQLLVPFGDKAVLQMRTVHMEEWNVAWFANAKLNPKFKQICILIFYSVTKVVSSNQEASN